MPDNAPLPLIDRLLDAALPHVAFDGWGPSAFRAAVEDLGVTESEARAAAPRGAADLAVRFHERGDERMIEAARRMRIEDMKIRARIATLIRLRIEAIEDREAVRKGAALFALPHMAADGARLMWNTADAIWDAAGDASRDVNWYTKRATLSGVYASTVLFWLGDASDGDAETWDFLDRRIEDVMRIEKAKAFVRGNPVLSALAAGPNWALSFVRAPARMARADLPGAWGPPPEMRTGDEAVPDVPQSERAPGVPPEGPRPAANAPGVETPGPAGAVASGPA